MRWICCRKKEMGWSGCSPSFGTWAWGWLWFNPWWYHAVLFPGIVSFSSNGWGSNQGNGFCILKEFALFLLISDIESFLTLCKGSFLIAEVMASKGYKVQPLPRVPRCDTVQVFSLILFNFTSINKNTSKVIFDSFFLGCTTWNTGASPCFLRGCSEELPCRFIYQTCCGYNSWICIRGLAGVLFFYDVYDDFVSPNIHWQWLSYQSQVIFADGTFIDGSTSELSCDGPLREPFAVFCQVCVFSCCITTCESVIFSEQNFGTFIAIYYRVLL